MVDLPEPVGPVTSTAPYERRKPSSNITSPWLDMPSWSRPISAWVLSRIRMTTPSPSTWGMVTTRRSIAWPSTVSDTRPSCGTRFSAMSRLAMIFTREIVPGTIRRGMCVLSRSTPSTRKRTRMSRPSGSKWMSEAPSSTPWAMIEFTSLITGASSADSRISVTSASSSSPSLTAAATASSSLLMRPIRPWMSSAEPTTGITSWPVISFRSSSASTFDGSAIATSSEPPSSNPIGTDPSRRAAAGLIRLSAATSVLNTDRST